MLPKLKGHWGDLFLGLFFLGLAGFSLWLVQGQSLEVETRTPWAWVHLHSGRSLVEGHWLGPSRSLALMAPPGYSFWVALAYWLGIPVAIASDLLRIFTGLLFLLTLRKMRVSPWLCALLAAILLLDPAGLDLLRKVSPASFALPWILLAASAYFLSIYQARGRAKVALWLLAGLAIAAYWIGLARPWVPIAMVVLMLFWEFSIQPPGHRWSERLRWLFPLVLALLLPSLTADLAIRSVNLSHYGRFQLQRKPSRIETLRWQDGDSIKKLFLEVARDPGTDPRKRHLEIRGWVAHRKFPIRGVELREAGGRTLAGSAEFSERIEVQNFLRGEARWEDPPLSTGFKIESPPGSPPNEELRLGFLGPGGELTEIRLENLGSVGPDLRYYLDSIDRKSPDQNFREGYGLSTRAWWSRLLGLLAIAGPLAGILLALAKVAGDGLKPADFWLLLLSVLTLLFLSESLRGDFRQYELAGRRSWPLATLFACQSLLLIREATRTWLENPIEAPGPIAWLRSLPVEKHFVALALTFGLFFVFFNPPFQAPDEGAHAFRSFQTAQGQPSSAPVPKSLGEVINRYWRLSFHAENKVSLAEIREGFRVPLEPERKSYLGSIGVTFIPYLPQAAGIFVGRIAGLPPLALLYLGRLGNLLVWVILVYWAIRKLPFFKWVFFFLALSPMALYEAASLSHDPFTIGISFLLVAHFLDYGFGTKSRLSWRQLLGLAILAMLAALAKVVYFPLVLLYFWIPVSKLGSLKRYLSAFAFLFVASFGIDFLWNLQTGTVKRIAQAATKANHGNEPSFILGHPWEFLVLVGRTLKNYYAFYLESFVGRLGWLDTPLPGGMLFLYGLILLLLSRRDRKEGYRFGLAAKALSLGVFLSIVGLLFVTFFLTWTPPGSSQIEGIQGRYLLPIAPLFLLIFYDNRRKAAASEPSLAWGALAAAAILMVAGTAMLSRFYYF